MSSLPRKLRKLIRSGLQAEAKGKEPSAEARIALSDPANKHAVQAEREHLAELAERRERNKERSKEVEDSPAELEAKVKKLADWVRSSSYTVAHTGAGLSAAASLPTFRGSDGIYTLARSGKDPNDDGVNFVKILPTFSHMCLAEMYRQGSLGHVVSQNIDGVSLLSPSARGTPFVDIVMCCT